MPLHRREENLRARPRALVGVTHPQTCLTLTGRIRALREAGFQVAVVASPGALLWELARREGAEVFEIPMRRELAPCSDLLSLCRLCLLLRRYAPDLVEFSTPKAGLLGSLAAWILRTPVRVYLLRGLKLEGCSGLKRRALLLAEQAAAACSTAVLCNSPSLRAMAASLGVAPERKLHLLGSGSSNGVDLRRFAPRAPGKEILPESFRAAPVIGFVGRLTRDKGIPELLEAFEQMRAVLPAVRLLLVGWFDEGEDALEAFWRARIERHPAICLTGMVRDAAPYYAAMDLLALPTRREGFPNVVLEAAASGLPVVTTTATGAVDSVLPGRTGLLVAPGEALALSEALTALLQNEALRKRMGQQARRWAVLHFADERVLARTMSFYGALLARSHARPAASLRAAERRGLAAS